MKKQLYLFGLLISVTLFAGCLKEYNELWPGAGKLEGKVTISPLCSVEPCNLTPEQIAGAYNLRKILIYAADSSTVIKKIAIEPDGTYVVILDKGHYVVDINYLGLDRSNDVPKAITITDGRIIKLNIDIDTGIRRNTDIP